MQSLKSACYVYNTLYTFILSTQSRLAHKSDHIYEYTFITYTFTSNAEDDLRENSCLIWKSSYEHNTQNILRWFTFFSIGVRFVVSMLFFCGDAKCKMSGCSADTSDSYFQRKIRKSVFFPHSIYWKCWRVFVSNVWICCRTVANAYRLKIKLKELRLKCNVM